ncbi:MAG: patatin-like phospholipase family protein [Planctomycetes bacterium]|nr:patatin-like phospholipase family protein [Planctomycetota bacterium]
MYKGKRVSLVLGGGGVKGLAHIGVLKALARRGIVPDEYVGSSVGSLVGAMAAGGMMPEDIERVALSIQRKDILDYNWKGLIWRRGRMRSLYLGDALHDLVRRILPVDRFDQLLKPAYMTSVDVNSGYEIIWGMPGWTDYPIHDCVVAACSVPGIYPPKEIGPYHLVDGSLVDTLPIKVSVYNSADLIIAVYLEEPVADRPRAVHRLGIGAILEQSQAILSRAILKHNLRFFSDAPLILITPHIPSQGMFQFERTVEVIREGEMAADHALSTHPYLKGEAKPAAGDDGRGRPPATRRPDSRLFGKKG